MGWQRGGSGTGEGPARVPGGPSLGPRDERLSGFVRGGEWDQCLPGPELAAVLAEVAGPEWRCPGAEPDELIGLLRRVEALESWTSSAKLAVIRELIRRDDPPVDGRTMHGDLPDQWSDSLNHGLALALASSVPAAEKMALAAWEFGARLPGIAALLAGGRLTCAKAKLIAETFQLLSDADAARAEALIIPQLTGTTGKTYGQIINLANRIAVEVDPGLAERRRKAAVKHASRVQLFREESGAAALCGRNLPPDETLEANARVNARAIEYKDSGAFPDARMDQLRSAAYLDLIRDITADERIALGYLSTDPDDDDPDAPAPPGDDGPGDDGPYGGPCNDGPGDDGPGHSGAGHDEPGGGVPGGGGVPRGGDGGAAHGDDTPGGSGGPGDSGASDGIGASEGSVSGGSAPAVRGQAGGCPVLTDLVIPLATLLGLAERPGEAHGLGVLDPGLCRDLAALAAASPHSRLCVTVTDSSGMAIGHGCARTGKPSGASPRSLPARSLPARLNVTITADRLSAMLAASSGLSGNSGRQPAVSAAGWVLTWAGRAGPRGTRGSPGDPEWCGTWTLTLPGGRQLVVPIVPVPTYQCDHRYQSCGYQPNDVLRHLVQVRDRTCTFPSCSRHAKDSDFEHARPYDQGGATCACNAGARSRKCHRIKQSKGWNVSQPKPGWHIWTTPSGRTYAQAPYQYPV